MKWSKIGFNHLNMTLKKSTFHLTWCMPYIPMKQTLFIANVLSSNCGRYFFLDQIWVCVYFSWWYPPRPPSHQKAVQETGKLIQEITKALVVYKIGPYICFISKSAPIYQVTLELLPLYRAGKKKTKKQIWEDSITPIQINLLPQNKRLEERSAQHISFGCANMAVSQEPVSGTLYCKEHKPKQVIVQPINIQEKKKCYQKKIAVCPL